MNEIFTPSTATFFYFMITGCIIVYLILRFDTVNRKKFNKVMLQAKDVQPMLLKKSAQQKLHTLKIACKDEKTGHLLVEKQLDKLVKDYDNGHINLHDYYNKLNRLLAMTA